MKPISKYLAFQLLKENYRASLNVYRWYASYHPQQSSNLFGVISETGPEIHTGFMIQPFSTDLIRFSICYFVSNV